MKNDDRDIGCRRGRDTCKDVGWLGRRHKNKSHLDELFS